MIQLSDNVLPHLLKFSHEELRVYLLINRYLTEDQPVPLDHIQRLTKLSDSKYSEILTGLIDSEALEFSFEGLTDPQSEAIDQSAPNQSATDQRNLALRDPINEKMGTVRLTERLKVPVEQYLDNIIYKKDKNKVKNKEESNKLRTAERAVNSSLESATRRPPWVSQSQLEQSSPSKLSELTTRRFKRFLNRLHNTMVKVEANQLVDHFANALLVLYSDMQLSPRWRTVQFSIARSLLKNYSYPLVFWKQAIDFFAEDKFWEDKLSHLKQIEDNIHRFLATKKRKPKTKVKTIN